MNSKIKKLKRNIILFILSILIVLNFKSFAQNEKGNLVYNVENNVIKLKWYSDQLVYPNGVNIFRKEKNKDWVKLNTIPIKRGKIIPQSMLNNDEELKQSYDIIKGLKTSDFKSIILLNAIVQSFKKDVFAEHLGIYYEENVIPNTSVKYKVTEVNNSLIAETDYISTSSNKKLSVPSSITVDKKRRKVRFNWKYEETMFWGVNIYRSKDDSAYVKINKYPILESTTENNKAPKFIYEDEGLKEKSTYKYYIKSLGFFEEESEKSKTYTFYIEDKTPPPSPYSLRKVDVKKNVVALKWKNSSFESDAIGNNVYRSTDVDSGYVKVNATLLGKTDTSFTETVGEEQGYFYYKVGAIDEENNIAYSDPLFVEVYDLFPPSKPVNFKAITDTGKVIFTWDKGNDKDLAGYRIYRTIKPKWKKNELMLVNKETIDTTVYIDNLPKRAKNKFYYFLIAIDGNYNHSEYAGPIQVQLPDVTPPSAPFIKNSYKQEDYVVVSFEKNTDADLMHYTLFRKDDKYNKWEQLNTNDIPPYVTEYKDRALLANTKYVYYMVATDSTGNRSERSNIVGVKTLAKNNTKTIEIEVKSKVKKKKNKATVIWTSTLEEDEMLGCTLYRRKSNQEYKQINKLTLNKKLYLEMDEQLYIYQLRVHDKDGTIYRKEFKIE